MLIYKLYYLNITNIKMRPSIIIYKKVLFKIKKIVCYAKAFTLLELLVTVTIFLILWSISYFSLVWFIKNSRDVVRLEDLKTIDKSISLFQIQKWFLPKPDDYVEINYSWSILWNQWIFWDNNFTQVGLINKKPVDIISNNEFSYSLSNNWREYELWALTEWNDINQFVLVPNTFASWKKLWKSLVYWNYNWRIIKSSSWSYTYLFSIPTIISRDISDSDINSIINNKQLAYKWYWNLPASYSWTIFKVDWWFDFNPNMFVLFSGLTEDLLYNESIRIKILENFQKSYSWTIIANESWIKEILNLDINPDSPSKKLKESSYDIFTNDLWVKLPIIVKSWDNWLSYDMSNLLLDADTRYITQDSNLDFWFATKKWVSKFTNWNWITFTEEDGLADIDTRSIIEDKDFSIWFATNKWVSKIDKLDSWSTYDDKSWLIDNDVVAMKEDNNWNIWFATKKWVSMFDWWSWLNFSQDKTWLVDKIVTSITNDSSNSIWFWTINWVSVFDWTTWTSYSESDWLIDKNILSIYSDIDDNIWLWTINWLSKFDWINWISYSESDWLSSKRVQEIFQDSNWTMWFWTDNWVDKFDWNIWINYDINDWLIDNDVQSIYQDNESNMWIWTKKGVTIFYK